MASYIEFYGAVFILGAILTVGIVLLIWWIKLKKIRKGMPEAKDKEAIHELNYDKEHLETMKAKKEVEENGNSKRKVGGNDEGTDRAEEEKIREVERSIRELQEE